jgi:very-short-patch-repair endonuclease
MLRKSMPEAEVILWSKLRRKQMGGYKFRRQYGVGRYSIDFYCPELELAIEVDGDSHFAGGAAKRDKERENFIIQFGIRFLRFSNADIRENLDGVLLKIEDVMRREKDKA